MLRISDVFEDIKTWANALDVGLQGPINKAEKTKATDLEPLDGTPTRVRLFKETLNAASESSQPEVSSRRAPSAKSPFSMPASQERQQRLLQYFNRDSDSETEPSTIGTEPSTIGTRSYTTNNTCSTNATSTIDRFPSAFRSTWSYRKYQKALRKSVTAEVEEHKRELRGVEPLQNPFQDQSRTETADNPLNPISTLKAYIASTLPQAPDIRDQPHKDKFESRLDSKLDNIQTVDMEPNVHRALVPYAYTDDNLVEHIRNIPTHIEDMVTVALRCVLQRRDELNPDNIMSPCSNTDCTQGDRLHSTFEVHNVMINSTVVPVVREQSRLGIFQSVDTTDDRDTWDAFKVLTDYHGRQQRVC